MNESTRKLKQPSFLRGTMGAVKSSKDINKVIREAGIRNLKAGSHPQQYRQTSPTPAKQLQGTLAKLGPMGELGDDVIIEVGISAAGEQLINRKITGQLNITNLFIELKREVYRPLLKYMEKWIDVKAPSDTGELRKSLKGALTSHGGSNVNKFPLFVILNTAGISYAKVVNEMPTRYVKHPLPTHTNIGRERDQLDDPGAVKGWYNWLLLMGRTEAEKLFLDFIKSNVVPIIRKITTTLGLNGIQVYNAARQIFAVKYL